MRFRVVTKYTGPILCVITALATHPPTGPILCGITALTTPWTPVCAALLHSPHSVRHYCTRPILCVIITLATDWPGQHITHARDTGTSNLGREDFAANRDVSLNDLPIDSMACDWENK